MPGRCGTSIRGARARSLGLICLSACLGVACSGLSHKVDPNRAPPVAVPERFLFDGQGGVADAGAAFWRVVGSAELDALCDAALRGNLDLRRAQARLEAAEALARVAGAGLLPQLSLDGSVSRSQQNLFLGRGAAGGKPLTVSQTLFPLSVGASYEVDLWGRIGSTRRAAQLDASASREDLDAMAIGVAGGVMGAYLGLVAERQTHELLRQQVDTNRKLLGAIELRFAHGLASMVDVLQQRSQLEAVVGQLPAVEARLRLQTQQLAALLGRLAQRDEQLASKASLPPVPPLPALGVPAALLDRRPDVRAARKRMLAVDHRVASAKVDLLPALRLSGTTGFTGRSEPLSFFDNFIFNLAAGLSAPLLDGGRRRAEVARVRATLQDAVYAYGQVVLRALQDVEEALAREEGERAGLLAAEQRLETVRKTLEEARFRYAHGQSDYLPVLTTLSTLQALEADKIQRQRAQWLARVGLMRALAGTVEPAGGPGR